MRWQLALTHRVLIVSRTRPCFSPSSLLGDTVNKFLISFFFLFFFIGSHYPWSCQTCPFTEITVKKKDKERREIKRNKRERKKERKKRKEGRRGEEKGEERRKRRMERGKEERREGEREENGKEGRKERREKKEGRKKKKLKFLISDISLDTPLVQASKSPPPKAPQQHTV